MDGLKLLKAGECIMGKSGIYKIQNLVTGKLYIGSAIDLQKRKKKHFSELKSNTHHSLKLQRSWNKHGSTAFDFFALEIVEKTKLIEREQIWIDSLRSHDDGYNMNPTAGSHLGAKHTDETRLKISMAHLGKKHTEEHNINNSNARKGKKLSEEHKLNMSKSLTGKKRTPEQRAAMAERSRNISDETRAKRSASMTGKKMPVEGVLKSAETKRKNGTSRPSDEHIKRLSQSNKGVKKTDEWKKNMSERMKGRVVSDETRAKISANKKGKKLSDETKERMSEAHKKRLATAK